MVSDSSVGINWRIIAAVAGLALIGISPSKQARAQPQTGQATNTITSQTATSDSAVPEQPVAPSPNEHCKRGEDNRKSDLCAQWKAADAAADAASWSWWQLWIGVAGLFLGGVTMVAAIAAAIYAKRAAVATESTVSIAQEAANGAETALNIANRNANAAVKLADQSEINAQRQMRAYIGVPTCNSYTLGNEFFTTTSITNYGPSPAHSLDFAAKMFLDENVTHADLKLSGKSNQIVLPRQSINVKVDDVANDGVAHNGRRIVLIEVQYKDIFENQWRLRHRFVCDTACDWRADAHGNYERQINQK